MTLRSPENNLLRRLEGTPGDVRRYGQDLVDAGAVMRRTATQLKRISEGTRQIAESVDAVREVFVVGDRLVVVGLRVRGRGRLDARGAGRDRVTADLRGLAGCVRGAADHDRHTARDLVDRGLGDQAALRTTERALVRVTPFVRRQLANRLGLRRVPEMSFAFDKSIAHQSRVEELLQEIHASQSRPRPDIGNPVERQLGLLRAAFEQE